MSELPSHAQTVQRGPRRGNTVSRAGSSDPGVVGPVRRSCGSLDGAIEGSVSCEETDSTCVSVCDDTCVSVGSGAMSAIAPTTPFRDGSALRSLADVVAFGSASSPRSDSWSTTAVCGSTTSSAGSTSTVVPFFVPN